jgi:hypothetical protein
MKRSGSVLVVVTGRVVIAGAVGSSRVQIERLGVVCGYLGCIYVQEEEYARLNVSFDEYTGESKVG